jgi:hypothetical protein
MRKVRVRIFAPNDHPSRVIGLFPFSPSSHRTKRRYYSLIRVIATTRLPLAFAQLRDRLMLKTGSTRRVPAPGVIISGQSGLLIALMEESARNEISCNQSRCNSVPSLHALMKYSDVEKRVVSSASEKLASFLYANRLARDCRKIINCVRRIKPLAPNEACDRDAPSNLVTSDPRDAPKKHN